MNLCNTQLLSTSPFLLITRFRDLSQIVPYSFLYENSLYIFSRKINFFFLCLLLRSRSVWWVRRHWLIRRPAASSSVRWWRFWGIWGWRRLRRTRSSPGRGNLYRLGPSRRCTRGRSASILSRSWWCSSCILRPGFSLSAASTHVWNAVLLHTLFPFHLVNEVTHLLNTGSGVIAVTYSPPDNTLRPTRITGLHPVSSLGKGLERWIIPTIAPTAQHGIQSGAHTVTIVRSVTIVIVSGSRASDDS